MDWKPSSDPGMDKARLQRGKITEILVTTSILVVRRSFNTFPQHCPSREKHPHMALRHESLTLFPHTFFFRLNLQHLLSPCSLRAKASGRKLSVHWQIHTASSGHMTCCHNSNAINRSINHSVNQWAKVWLKVTELQHTLQLWEQHLCLFDEAAPTKVSLI